MTDKTDQDDQPPILGTWKNVYVFVLGNLIVLISLLYLFTKYYS